MIVVFGAGGFIGAYLVEKLIEEKYEVLAVDIDPSAQDYYKKKNVPYKTIDISNEKDFEVLPFENVEAVINVACLQPVNVSVEKYKSQDYIKTNVIGTLNVLDYCKAMKAKLIYTISHRGVQGLWDKGEVITEESEKALKYTGDYAMFAISEAAVQDCIKHYEAQYGVKSIVLRLPPVYGYGPHFVGYKDGELIKSGFATFIDNAIEGKPLELWGDYYRNRDIIYVKDVVTAIILAIRSKEVNGLYNISGCSVSLYGEASAIFKVFSKGTEGFKFKRAMPNSIEMFKYNVTKAKRDLQWESYFSVENMMEDIKKEMERKEFEFLLKKRDK